MAGHDPDRGAHRPPVEAHFVLVLVVIAEALGSSGADKGRVVPGDRGELPGQLLEPGVVRKAPIPDRGVGTENNLKTTGAGGGRAWRTRRGGQRHLGRRRSR